jgi:hypothetical protein
VARLFQFVAPLLRLPAVVAMPALGPAQIILCPADSLLASPIAVAVSKCRRGQGAAKERENDQRSYRYFDLAQYVGHGSSFWGTVGILHRKRRTLKQESGRVPKVI